MNKSSSNNKIRLTLNASKMPVQSQNKAPKPRKSINLERVEHSNISIKNNVKNQLISVESKLKTARLTISDCQNTMRLLFDKHHECFDDDKIIDALHHLAACLIKMYDIGGDGISQFETVIQWVEKSDLRKQ